VTNFGNTSQTSNYGLAANRWFGAKFTLSEAGTVTDLYVYASDGGTYKLAIYSDSSGPATLQYGDNTGTYTDGTAWVHLASLSVALSAGDYWLLTKVSASETKNVGISAGTTNASYCATTAGLYAANWAASAQAVSGTVAFVKSQ